MTRAAPRWFANLGLPLSAADLRHAQAYLDALGYGSDTRTEPVAGWREAGHVIRDPCWDRAWWQREQQERERLMEQATALAGEGALLERLSAATELMDDPLHASAAAATARGDNADEALIRAAAGAVALSLHQAALALLARSGPDHLFMRKYRIVESGRWPLGVLRGVFHLF